MNHDTYRHRFINLDLPPLFRLPPLPPLLPLPLLPPPLPPLIPLPSLPDEDTQTSLSGTNEDIIKLPTMRHPPRTRSGIKSLREEFNNSVESMITLLEHEELKQRLLSDEIIRETPSEAHGLLTSASASKEDCTSSSHHDSLGSQAAKDVGEISTHACLLPKIPKIAMLPVLQGIRDVQVFSISRAISGGNE